MILKLYMLNDQLKFEGLNFISTPGGLEVKLPPVKLFRKCMKLLIAVIFVFLTYNFDLFHIIWEIFRVLQLSDLW